MIWSLSIEKALRTIIGNGSSKLYFYNKIKRDKNIDIDAIADKVEIDFRSYLSVNKPYLTFNQIYEMINEGFYFGGHGKNHLPYQKMKLDEMIEDTNYSIKFIKNNFDLKYFAFAFPFGDINIPQKYFDYFYSKKLVDLTFGTNGFRNDIGLSNFQRIIFDRSGVPSKVIINDAMIKKLLRRKQL